MKILITGCAGFIGYHLCKKILKDHNFLVFGIDNLNDYYDVRIKKDRFESLLEFPRFKFLKIDISKKNYLDPFMKKNKFDIVINLAAQAGVRYSVDNPEAYLKSRSTLDVNITPQTVEHSTHGNQLLRNFITLL